MVIDDEELLTKTFSRLLEKQNYDVRAASRPDEAIGIIEAEDFDLVLCDIRMPGKNGVETMQALNASRRAQGRPPVPVIFLTGFADNKIEADAEALHPVAYVYKPFDTIQLLELIAKTLTPR